MSISTFSLVERRWRGLAVFSRRSRRCVSKTANRARHTTFAEKGFHRRHRLSHYTSRNSDFSSFYRPLFPVCRESRLVRFFFPSALPPTRSAARVEKNTAILCGTDNAGKSYPPLYIAPCVFPSARSEDLRDYFVVPGYYCSLRKIAFPRHGIFIRN